MMCRIMTAVSVMVGETEFGVRVVIHTRVASSSKKVLIHKDSGSRNSTILRHDLA